MSTPAKRAPSQTRRISSILHHYKSREAYEAVRETALALRDAGHEPTEIGRRVGRGVKAIRKMLHEDDPFDGVDISQYHEPEVLDLNDITQHAPPRAQLASGLAGALARSAALHVRRHAGLIDAWTQDLDGTVTRGFCVTDVAAALQRPDIRRLCVAGDVQTWALTR